MIASPRAWRLRDATVDMVLRLSQSERDFAFASADHRAADRDRAHRACQRRFKAILRLTAALRDVEVTR